MGVFIVSEWGWNLKHVRTKTCWVLLNENQEVKVAISTNLKIDFVMKEYLRNKLDREKQVQYLGFDRVRAFV